MGVELLDDVLCLLACEWEDLGVASLAAGVLPVRGLSDLEMQCGTVLREVGQCCTDNNAIPEEAKPDGCLGVRRGRDADCAEADGEEVAVPILHAVLLHVVLRVP